MWVKGYTCIKENCEKSNLSQVENRVLCIVSSLFSGVTYKRTGTFTKHPTYGWDNMPDDLKDFWITMDYEMDTETDVSDD